MKFLLPSPFGRGVGGEGVRPDPLGKHLFKQGTTHSALTPDPSPGGRGEEDFSHIFLSIGPFHGVMTPAILFSLIRKNRTHGPVLSALHASRHDNG